jgi:hypothetical protein
VETWNDPTQPSHNPSLSDAPLPNAALFEKGGDWIRANTANGHHRNAIFPDVRSGRMGLHAFGLVGDAAERLAELGQAWFSGARPLSDFDADRHGILAVNATENDLTLFVSVIDRRRGDVTHVGEMHLVDLTTTVGQKDFERIVGPVAEFAPGGSYEDVEPTDLLSSLLGPGVPIDIGNPLQEIPGRVNYRALEWQVEELQGAWAAENASDGLATVQLFQTAEKDHLARAGERELRALFHSDPEHTWLAGVESARQEHALAEHVLDAAHSVNRNGLGLEDDDEVDRIAGEIDDVLDQLGGLDRLDHAVVMRQAEVLGVNQGRPVQTEARVFCNRETGDYVAFVVRAGSD